MGFETNMLYGGDEASEKKNVTDLKSRVPFRRGRRAWDQNCGC